MGFSAPDAYLTEQDVLTRSIIPGKVSGLRHGSGSNGALKAIASGSRRMVARFAATALRWCVERLPPTKVTVPEPDRAVAENITKQPVLLPLERMCQRDPHRGGRWNCEAKCWRSAATGSQHGKMTGHQEHSQLYSTQLPCNPSDSESCSYDLT